MDYGLATYGLSLAAGTLSTLSPCVLPLAPILVGAALSAHRLGPLALAGGLTLSFAVLGTLIASLGAAAGLDSALFRQLAAVLLLGFAAILLWPRLQERFAASASVLAGAGQTRLARLPADGLTGQFVLGLLLGVVWTPCVGPTLGAAVTLASQGQALLQVAGVMALFGVGAGLPLLALGLASRQAMRRRGRLLAAGVVGKRVLGGALLVVGLAILSGADKTAEAWLLHSAPEWLLQLTTSL